MSMFNSKVSDQIAKIRSEKIIKSHVYKITKGNSKTGPIPTTYTDVRSCPESCPLYGKGCYAGVGPTSWSWLTMLDPDSKHSRSNVSFEFLLAFIKELPKGQLWRHNVGGDLPGFNTQIDFEALELLTKANRGKQGFTYTHKYRDKSGNLMIDNIEAIKKATDNGFTINLSSDNYDHADQLLKHGLPVVTLQPEDNLEKTYRTRAGNLVITCPYSYNKKIRCNRCKLCYRKADRGFIIGFPAHGVQKKHVNLISTLTIEEQAA